MYISINEKKERKEVEELDQLCANYLIDTNRTIFSVVLDRSNNKAATKDTSRKTERIAKKKDSEKKLSSSLASHRRSCDVKNLSSTNGLRAKIS